MEAKVKKRTKFSSPINNMAFDSDRGFRPRETVKGNWKCSDCGVEITELPFEPAQDRPIYCKECWSKRRPKRDFNR
ncbi:MAG: hypothetical protein NT012_02170 [Candidatus Nealsonbacteria bacterium]|nr:hypothetical protein [Candidatus Nealsonbacteria bacterium]